MNGIDKIAMGRRIKEIRKAAGLRQWQLAQILGTTQSAVHKYEHGVIPEPRRLIELARLGKTSIEWLLTGRHWENGSEEKERIDEETFQLAVALRRFDEKERRVVEDAMRILTDAAGRVERENGRPVADIDPHEIANHLKSYSEETRRVLTAALAVHRAVMRTVLTMQESRLSRTAAQAVPAPTPSDPSAARGAKRRQPA
jgi:transcriptional regulator with XRE-family HTH domain